MLRVQPGVEWSYAERTALGGVEHGRESRSS